MKPHGMGCRPPTGAAQAGSVLIVALILLTLLTIMTITSFRLEKGNLQIVGNAQQKTQSFAAAQSAIEEAISTPQFAKTPNKAIRTPCKGDNTYCTDVNGDGVNDVTVAVVPTCISSQIIPTAALDLTLAEDKQCTTSADETGGSQSLCGAQLWDMQATATDDLTGAQFVANQGVALRRPIEDMTCP